MIRKVFIGFDERQPVAFQISAASVARNSSVPVSVCPLILHQLPISRKGLTSFTFSRYLVPWLCNYEGHALFIDGDTLCMGDIAELPWDTYDAVSYVPHDTVLKDGKTVDVRFERPSVMLFNCEKCTALTPEFVETGQPHKLNWTTSIGNLPREWNYLVGYSTGHNAKLAHFTMGIPVFEETKTDEYSEEWREALASSNSTCSWAEIMGNSVHAKWKQTPIINAFMKAQGFK